MGLVSGAEAAIILLGLFGTTGAFQNLALRRDLPQPFRGTRTTFGWVDWRVGVDREVHATAGREASATSLRPALLVEGGASG